MILKSFKPSISEIGPLIEEAISNNNNVRLTVTGFSMYPLLRGGSDDVILTKADTVKKYDVVLFKRSNGSYIFHRVIKKKGDILTIAGDNETKKEHPVMKDAVIAKMNAFIRNGKLHSTSEIWYRAYSVLWLIIFPARHKAALFVHTSANFFRKIKRRFCREKTK